MDLTTRYLGLTLTHPVIASASPLSRNLDGIRRLEDAGAAAVVMASIYEEEIVADEAAYFTLTHQGAYTHPEAPDTYFPEVVGYGGPLESRLDTLRRAVAAVRIPVIASLNGRTHEGWVEFARELEDAGASAIELNLYRVPADLSETGAAVEQGYLEVVRAVKKVVSIPIAVKIGPWFSSPGNMALRLVEAGADGLVLFNRFYEPDIDLMTLESRPDLHLSTPNEIRLPLMWISLLAGRVNASIAATSGVAGHQEVAKYVLAGADAVMTTSALLRNGPGYLRTIVEGLDAWLDGRGFLSIEEARGHLAATRLEDPEAIVRAQYIEILTGYHSAVESTKSADWGGAASARSAAP
jgi:dihydroorotate dehydrogenase (fumarate)